MLKLLAGNWKMNGSRDTIQTLLSQIKAYSTDNAVQLAVFPPFTYLEQTAQMLSDSALTWGAQNLSAEECGAFTGEVSAAMLVDFGCRYVIVGHSERRLFYGESDDLTAKKCLKALEHHLIPILCVGETQEERSKGLTENIVERQLLPVIQMLGVEALEQIVIAYEPVWAIGTGLTASPEEAEAVHAFLRGIIAKKNAMIASKLPILYGGSLKASNAKALFSMPNIDGGLVGGASLEGKEFLEIATLLA